MEKQSRNVSATLWITCFLMGTLLVEISLGYYIYKRLKSDFHEEFVKELRTEVFKEELKEILKGPQFSQYQGAQVEFLKTVDRGGTVRKGSKNDSRVWITNYSTVPLEALQEFCKETKQYCQEPTYSKRRRRHIINDSEPCGCRRTPGPPGPRGDPGPRGVPGQNGVTGPRGLKGEQGCKGNAGDAGLHGQQGPRGLPGPNGLIGPRGYKGDSGHKGDAGEAGLSGNPGPRGLPGHQGSLGARGPQGPPGIKGPQGTPGLQGPTGPKGIRGDPGAPGLKGDKGFSRSGGNKGEFGVPGSPGERGKPGLSGLPGLQGKVGKPGLPGLTGRPGLNGLPGLKGEMGKPGNASLNGNPQDGSPGLPCEQCKPGLLGLPGPQGETGKPGLPGLDGRPGLNGKDGLPGLQGQMGKSGLPGLNGLPGEKGEMGHPGLPGPLGPPVTASVPGLPGPRGPKGDRGDSGVAGLKGDTGLPGPPGLKGERGLPGLLGEPGPKGLDGVNGLAGSQGIKGEPGLHGLPGALASKGAVGLPGPKGPPGPQGPPGQCHSCFDEAYRLYKPNFRNSKGKVSKYGNGEYPGYFSRVKECLLTAIGAPVNYGTTDDPFGSWMVDSSATTNDNAQKIWITNENNSTLFEYDSDTSFRLCAPPVLSYNLPMGFEGNSHLINNGSFFYMSRQKEPQIIKFSLNNRTSQSLCVPGVTSKNLKPLYVSGFNYFDLSFDENGLWVIFAVPDSSNTGVMKVNADTMTAEYIWNITLNHHEFREMFVVSGVLYAIDTGSPDEASISFAMDLYKSETVEVDLNTIECFGKLTMATFDYLRNELMVWDKGQRLTYPVLCENSCSGRKEVMAQ